jgi:outer membrane autotransporter protein
MSASFGTLIAAGAVAPASAQTAVNLNALQGLIPFSTLGNTAAGKAALSSNFTITGQIQSGTANQPLLLPFAQQQQQALSDATITSSNAYQLADGLGTKLGGVYQSKTTYTSTNDGTTTTSTNISTNIANLLTYTSTLTGSDSNAGKYFFSNGTTNGTTPASAAALALLTAAGGKTDVFGTAYNLPGGTTGADPFGDSRPYQTLAKVTLYSGNDFFGVSGGNSAYLYGPTQNLAASPSFPSGHTTYGYTESVLLGILVPQRFQQMITRGSEYGNDRIILGAHYTMDVIAGRTLALYDIAQLLANNPAYVGTTQGGVTISNYQTALSAASTDLNSALASGCGNTVAACATQDTSRFSNSAANKAAYEATQTYGLPVVYANNTAPENVATIAPEAGYLLQTRFPYLTLAQRDDVLTTTEGPGGGFLDNGSAFGLYSRLDLYTAADGYGAFNGPVAISMDATQGGFNAFDSFNNNIGGTGSFSLSGTGTLQFTGANTYTGPTTINGGTLVVTGSIVSPTTIAAGGTLAGTGTVGAITNQGSIAPGLPAIASPTGVATIGTLSSTGPVSFAAGSTLAIKYAPIGADNLTTTGTAALAGTVVATGAPGTYRFNQAYPVLDAKAGISGQFQALNVTGLSNAYLPTLTYGPTEVDLVLAPNRISTQLPRGGSTNQASIASGLDRVLLTGNAPAAYVNLFNVPTNQLAGTINGLAGQAVAATQTTALRTGGAFLGAMLDPTITGRQQGISSAARQEGATVRLADNAGGAGTIPQGLGRQSPWTLWANATGGSATTSGSASVGSSKVTDSEYGIVAGADYTLLPQARVGFALSAGGTQTSVNNGLGSADGSYGQIGIDGSYGLGNAYVAGALGYTHAGFNAKRLVFFGGVDNLKSNPQADLFSGRVEAGYRVSLAAIDLTPYAAVEGQSAWTGAISEDGTLTPTNFGLAYRASNTSSLQTELGSRAAARFALSPTMDLTTFGRLAWVHEANRDRSINAAFLALPSAGFTIASARPAADAALISAGVAIDLHNGFSLTASGEGTVSSTVSAVRGQLGIRYAW